MRTRGDKRASGGPRSDRGKPAIQQQLGHNNSSATTTGGHLPGQAYDTRAARPQQQELGHNNSSATTSARPQLQQLQLGHNNRPPPTLAPRRTRPKVTAGGAAAATAAAPPSRPATWKTLRNSSPGPPPISRRISADFGEFRRITGVKRPSRVTIRNRRALSSSSIPRMSCWRASCKSGVRSE